MSKVTKVGRYFPAKEEQIFKEEKFKDPKFVAQFKNFVNDNDTRHGFIYIKPDLSRPLITYDIVRPHILKSACGRILRYVHCNPLDQKIILFNRTYFTFMERLMDIAIALGPMCLPPYVVLEIIDHLPGMEKLKHGDKVSMLIGIMKSYRRLIEKQKQTKTKWN